MEKRGYPMGDFERRAGDISVDHPDVVANYQTAQAIAVRDQHGSADTEELRKAVVHYRALFDELLEVREPRQEIIEEKRVAAPIMKRSQGKDEWCLACILFYESPWLAGAAVVKQSCNGSTLLEKAQSSLTCLWLWGNDYGEWLIYIAKVSQKPPVSAYYRSEKFKGRPDCIHEELGGVNHSLRLPSELLDLNKQI